MIFVSKQGEATTYSMSEASDGDNMELRKRFKYAHDVLTKKEASSPRGSTSRPHKLSAGEGGSNRKLKIKRVKTNESRSGSPDNGLDED